MPQYSWMLEELPANENETESSGVGGSKFRVDEKYRKFIKKIVSSAAKAQGFNVPKVQLEEDIDDLLNFTWKLTKVSRA